MALIVRSWCSTILVLLWRRVGLSLKITSWASRRDRSFPSLYSLSAEKVTVSPRLIIQYDFKRSYRFDIFTYCNEHFWKWSTGICSDHWCTILLTDYSKGKVNLDLHVERLVKVRQVYLSAKSAVSSACANETRFFDLFNHPRDAFIDYTIQLVYKLHLPCRSVLESMNPCRENLGVTSKFHHQICLHQGNDAFFVSIQLLNLERWGLEVILIASTVHIEYPQGIIWWPLSGEEWNTCDTILDSIFTYIRTNYKRCIVWNQCEWKR